MPFKAGERPPRSKAGCMTCKLRKKKCDEVKPRCAGCRRNQVVCEWPSWVNDAGSSKNDGDLTLSHTARYTPAGPGNEHQTTRISPPVSVIHAGAQRPCSLTPQSVILLSHYLRETVGCIAMTPMGNNPFVTILLPLGYVDDLLMHALLAVSGAHLTYNEPDSIELATATALHYSCLVTQLRTEFSQLQEGDIGKQERLLRVLLVVCHYEAISGNTDGTIFNHLRASRHLILSLLAHRSKEICRPTVNRETLGLSIEIYTYLAACNTVSPYGFARDRTLALDGLITSVVDLKSFPTFGVLFAGGHELYQLVPTVSLLASRRLAEDEAAYTELTPALCALHDDIHARLSSWTMPAAAATADEPTEDYDLRRQAGEALRHAVHIYLATALAGATVADPNVRAYISQHVKAVFAATPSLVAARRYVATMLWPVLIAGSCISSSAGQQLLLSELRGGWFQMRQLEVLGRLLSLLWEDRDPRAFGPYGLYLMMKKHGLNIANA